MIIGSRLGRTRRPLCIDLLNRWRYHGCRLRRCGGAGHADVAAMYPNTAQCQAYSNHSRNCPGSRARVNFARNFADDAYAKECQPSDHEEIVEAHFPENFQPIGHMLLRELLGLVRIWTGGRTVPLD